ncbi:tRNA uridine-5-carboxymethylaminomethyl(34) synthesis GTPase MnmE [Ramlibacter sp. AW1]|uniref:tRNA modification GTPase MnmE n=1 Tax=Ramlibacter aurantiacus TaxID=2801330 RepID=A0A937D5F3_9BURK|nr:tRNA uridine-5-carboxymethylaminomethyl(34) synthesis GTPase MnmE [Ramlibacter aurantiacus]MBL0421267.1 tRNA uridine-5-carboxymethylaminomethyl(34) synthesis GTPase MnmE [Ramlibacter aurantiacus]
MRERHDPPIVAIATAAGRGAVGIVRVSAADVRPLVEAICGQPLQPRQATYLPFKAADGSTIDHGLAIHFPAPHSYTGEDVLELQAHGGPVVLQLLLARCLEAGSALGLRVAEPGEFTRRAFLNDKIDLAQAEAIADLIDASTEAAVRSASRSLAGEFSREVRSLRDALIHLRMLVEATLDFPEEEIDFLEQSDARGQLHRLQAQLDRVLQRTRQGALLREGIHVVIAGQPNAGKSSLLNALAGAELAIVTPVPGTTRDVVRQTIQIEGVPLHVIDTAGLRESQDLVEQIGIERAWDQIGRADVVILLHDVSRSLDPAYRAGDEAIREAMRQRAGRATPVVDVWNKVDLAAPAGLPVGGIALSARTGAGLDGLRRSLLQHAGWQSAPEGVWLARERHVQALARVRQHLELGQQYLQPVAPALDLLAEELRLAQNALNEITGEFSADDLLGVIFSSFCIGK